MTHETKFTKGPWRLDPKEGISSYFDEVWGQYIGVCDKNACWPGLASVVIRMEGEGTDSEEGVANAHLIAAAPELYEALNYFIAEFDATRVQFNGQCLQIRNSVYDQAKAALAKARGEAQPV